MAQTILAAIAAINPLFRRPLVEQAMGESRSTIYRKIKAGLLTKPVQIYCLKVRRVACLMLITVPIRL